MKGLEILEILWKMFAVGFVPGEMARLGEEGRFVGARHRQLCQAARREGDCFHGDFGSVLFTRGSSLYYLYLLVFGWG